MKEKHMQVNTPSTICKLTPAIAFRDPHSLEKAVTQ